MPFPVESIDEPIRKTFYASIELAMFPKKKKIANDKKGEELTAINHPMGIMEVDIMVRVRENVDIIVLNASLVELVK